jgi:uncharacterized protein YpuA (DUF1002 family)
MTLAQYNPSIFPVKYYSNYLKEELFKLPKKDKYTLRDLKNLQLDSLFKLNVTLTDYEAKQILIVNASFYGTDWSKSVSNIEELCF